MDIKLVVTLVGAAAAIWLAGTLIRPDAAWPRQIVRTVLKRRCNLRRRLMRLLRVSMSSAGGSSWPTKVCLPCPGQQEDTNTDQGTAKLDRIVNDIGDKRKIVAAMQKTACHLLEDGLETLNDEQIARHRLELKGHLVHTEEIRRGFESDLASVENQRQSSLERQKSR